MGAAGGHRATMPAGPKNEPRYANGRAFPMRLDPFWDRANATSGSELAPRRKCPVRSPLFAESSYARKEKARLLAQREADHKAALGTLDDRLKSVRRFNWSLRPGRLTRRAQPVFGWAARPLPFGVRCRLNDWIPHHRAVWKRHGGPKGLGSPEPCRASLDRLLLRPDPRHF
jgi:hypothetical protein